MSWLDFVILGLSAWRMASLLVDERGPFDICSRIRDFFVGEGEIRGIGLLFTCIWCMGVWTAGISYAVWTVSPVPIIILAVSALVIVVEEFIESFNSNKTEPPGLG